MELEPLFDFHGQLVEEHGLRRRCFPEESERHSMFAGPEKQIIAGDGKLEEELPGHDVLNLSEDVPAGRAVLIDHRGQNAEDLGGRVLDPEFCEVVENLRQRPQAEGLGLLGEEDEIA